MRKVMLILSFIAISTSYATGGFYAGIGAGYSTINNTTQSNLTFNNGSSGSQSNAAPLMSIYGGYDFNRYIGLQLDYDVLFNAQIASSYGTTQQLVGGSVMLHLPFDLFADVLSGFSLFAKGGIGYSVFNFNNTGNTCPTCINPPGNAYAFVPIYGIGAEYGFNNIGFRLEYDGNGSVNIPNNGVNQLSANSNLYLISILYHF